MLCSSCPGRSSFPAGSDFSWSGDIARSCPVSSGGKLGRGCVRCLCSRSHSPSSLDRYDGPLSLNSRGRCRTLTRSRPDACSAACNVSDTWVAAWSCTASRPGCSAREIVEHGGQVEPAPADDLEVGEVGGSLDQGFQRRRRCSHSKSRLFQIS
jgi:hypothetical protein